MSDRRPYPAKCYSETGRLRIPWPLWLVIVLATQHLWSRLLPMATLLPAWPLVAAPVQWLWPIDLLVLLGILAGAWRGKADEGPGMLLWCWGWHLLVFAYVVLISVFVFQHWELINDPERDGFGLAVSLLVLDLGALGYLLLSPLARDVFSDDPVITGQQAPAYDADGVRQTRIETIRDQRLQEAAALLSRYSATADLHPMIEDRHRAIMLVPEDATAWHDLGLLALEIEDLDQAIDCVRQAARLAPESPTFLRNLGELCRRRGWHDEALESLQGALLLDPTQVESHYNLGVLLATLNRWQGASEAYRRALQLDPSHRRAWHNLSIALHRLGRLDDAGQAMRRAEQLVRA